jgi:hypothetical protein
LVPVSVPETEICEPSERAPRSVITLRYSSETASVIRRTSMPRCSASTGALTYETVSDTTLLKTPLSAASLSTLTSKPANSPRTSTSIDVTGEAARPEKTWPSFSTSGMPGRT